MERQNIKTQKNLLYADRKKFVTNYSNNLTLSESSGLSFLILLERLVETVSVCETFDFRLPILFASPIATSEIYFDFLSHFESGNCERDN